ncbi:uncharacterized protein BDV14DRAFT_138873 [Aspergillus stella-maris]|uniref:uncharacterized protein n=1 Tax=Aspergillus stella-maris TaxID=1810926 RepID=UPI003CCD1EF9
MPNQHQSSKFSRPGRCEEAGLCRWAPNARKSQASLSQHCCNGPLKNCLGRGVWRNQTWRQRGNSSQRRGERLKGWKRVTGIGCWYTTQGWSWIGKSHKIEKFKAGTLESLGI